jgi:oligoendopeptidase F
VKRRWRVSAERRLADRGKIDEIYEELLRLREKIASNADMANYRDWVWKGYKRFDYTPEDCLKFADAIAQTCVPVVRELDERRRGDLKVRSCGRGIWRSIRKTGRLCVPLRSRRWISSWRRRGRFSSGCRRSWRGILTSCASTRTWTSTAARASSRGGYQCSLEEAREPFIFMNAAGLQRDVETLLHEGGHAFHCLAGAQ